MKKISFVLCIICMLQLASCGKHYSYSEYGHYDNFSTVKSDFQSVCQLLSDEGNNTYYIKTVNQDTNDKKISDSTKIELTNINKHETLNLIATDQTHLRNILENSDFCWIEVEDGAVSFEYDAIGCGVVATSNIKKFISDLENKADDYWEYEKLSDGWYTYYR
ncbi:MAG: hypothetical protein K2K91_09180 [Ruminococcus sp.]|nr:hypothetical protein [Ruminococcus sp.]